MERRVLSAILHDRESFDKLRAVLDLDDFGDRSKLVVEQIISYYDADANAKKIDVDVLVAHFHRNYEKHGQIFESFIRGLEEVSAPNIVKEYTEFKKEQLTTKLGHACLSKQYKEMESLIDALQTISASEEDKDESIYVNPDIDLVLEANKPDNLVRLVPRSLNDAVGGGVCRGHHIIVFARPEVGKSLVSINMASGFLSDGEKVLYIGNEDPAPQMITRFYARLSGMTKAEMLKDPNRARELAKERGIGNLIFAGLSPGTLQEIENLIKKHSPTVLVLDQLTNLSCKVDGEVAKYLYLAQRIRALGKKYNLVTVSVCQAGDSATNKLVLEQSDVFFSNTAIPAQADLMVGVGANPDMLRAGRRMFSLPKNKVNNNHESFAVAVDPTLSKVISV